MILFIKSRQKKVEKGKKVCLFSPLKKKEERILFPINCFSLTILLGDMIEINFKGMLLNPLSNEWSWTEMDLMNYACSARKPMES